MKGGDGSAKAQGIKGLGNKVTGTWGLQKTLKPLVAGPTACTPGTRSSRFRNVRSSSTHVIRPFTGWLSLYRRPCGPPGMGRRKETSTKTGACGVTSESIISTPCTHHLLTRPTSLSTSPGS